LRNKYFVIWTLLLACRLRAMEFEFVLLSIQCFKN
jgi:hypothetical protein